ncbi:hypothetical protein ACXA45_02540 [Neomicrococcus lactis]
MASLSVFPSGRSRRVPSNATMWAPAEATLLSTTLRDRCSAEILNDQRIGRITPGAFADAVVLTDELELSVVMQRGDWL